jgi:hypothetical protein
VRQLLCSTATRAMTCFILKGQRAGDVSPPAVGKELMILKLFDLDSRYELTGLLTATHLGAQGIWGGSCDRCGLHSLQVFACTVYQAACNM